MTATKKKVIVVLAPTIRLMSLSVKTVGEQA
jgi:hypothetical protein